MAASNGLRLEPATLEDIPAITDLWFAAFTDPDFRRLWPDTPGVRKWWDDTNRNDMLTKPFQKYLKVVDPSAVGSDGRPRIVSYAKWDLAMIPDRGRRYLPWHEDMAIAECDEFFEREDRERMRVMGDEKHYCKGGPFFFFLCDFDICVADGGKDLDSLATHPEYQRRGAGSMLVKWGCDLADRDGVKAYVDGSKDGAPLYERFGFVDESVGDGMVASMARR